MVSIYAPNEQDAVNLYELRLYNDLMSYRASLYLAPIPLSKAMSTTAARHVVDIADNLGTAVPSATPGENRAHSWSDAPYNAKDESTYGAIWSAPQRLGTGYPGYGFEILATGAGSVYFGSPDQTSAVLLNAWRMSPAHNAVMINEDVWSRESWNAVGVGLYKSSAAIWFGREADPAGAPAIVGSAQSDNAALTPYADTIVALEGDDLVYGNAGNDLICGNAGNDSLFGGKDADTLYGGQGADQLFGNLGNDVLQGNLGNDLLRGGVDNDTLFGGVGDDSLYGDLGNDWLSGDKGNDVLTGGDGADIFAFGVGGGQDVIADFNPGAGDRIHLAPGMPLGTGATLDGSVVLSFGGEDFVRLQGVTAFDQSWLMT